MAFPRRRSRFRSRFPRRRSSFRRTRGSSFARKKYDKVQFFNNLNQDLTNSINPNFGCESSLFVNCREALGDCGPADPGVIHCCSSTATFLLVDNTGLNISVVENDVGSVRSYGGTVTVVRIYGDIYFRSLLAFPTGSDQCLVNSPPTIEQYGRRYGEMWTWGLRKFNITDSAFINSPVGPSLAIDFADLNSGWDWTEEKWLWQRRNFWAPTLERSQVKIVPGAPIGVCSNTHRAGYVVPATASGSQPTYNVPAETTDCGVQTIGEDCFDIYRGLQVREPPWHHIRVNIRKHITLRGDERLDLQCGVRHPAMPGSTTGWGCQDLSGFPGEFANYRVFMRLAGVVRLN